MCDWLVADEIFGGLDAGLAVHYFGGAWRGEIAIWFFVEVFCDGVEEVEEAETFATGDVDGFATEGLVGCAGEEVGVNGVGDVCEVACLSAIAVDGGFFVLEERIGEARKDGGVGGIRALAWAEDVEVAEADAGETEAVAVGAEEMFACEFCGGVGGKGQGLHGFKFWELC